MAVAPVVTEKPKLAVAPRRQAEAPQVANVEDPKPEDLPPALLEHPELFLRSARRPPARQARALRGGTDRKPPARMVPADRPPSVR